MKDKATRARAKAKRGDASDGATSFLGGRVSRIDGPVKIKGVARYALEHHPENMAHAVMVQSTIPAGRIRAIDSKAVEAAPGVILILTPDNIQPLKSASTWLNTPGPAGPFLALTKEITFTGQHVAAVVAETFEQATAAASLLKIDYEIKEAIATFADPKSGDGVPIDAMTVRWGEPEKAFAEAPVRIEHEYRTPREYNVPIEPHGLIAQWQGDRLTVWEPSQWVNFMSRTYAEWFDIPFENVRLISPYVGGGFGSKGFAYAHGAIAAIAARMLQRPVKLAVTRPQTFTAFGGRPATRQTLALGATREGRILSLVQKSANETSADGMWIEPMGSVTALMYATPNLLSHQNVVPVNTVLPSALRAPGENPSAYGIECAIDELAYEVGIDPLAIRLLNYAEEDPQVKKAWSTRRLREAYEQGAKVFGWAKRSPAPRSMRDGHHLIGWGVAAGTYPVRRTPGEALVRILENGRVEVASSGIDMGQGTYTILAQTAAEVIGVSVDKVEVKLGDSVLPGAPVAGGSQLANLMTGAVHKAAGTARDALIGLAINDANSPFRALQANTLTIADGEISSPRGGPGLPIAELMHRLGRDKIEVTGDTFPEKANGAEDRHAAYTSVTRMLSPSEGDYSRHSWCVHFIEVRVDEDFGTVRVSRVVSAFDSGRIYNPKLAESQWKGGIIMGIGQALLEEGLVDRRNGRVINNNLGDYLIATNADIPDIEVISVGVPDFHASVLGGKAVGELGIVGVAPAIANAVYHATGKRIRDLPITLEKLL